jgi:hypothetical protein
MRLGLCRAKKWIDLFNNNDKKNNNKTWIIQGKRGGGFTISLKGKELQHTEPKPTKIDVELTWE